MIRGTTAPFKFSIPYPFNEVSKIVATFKQKHNTGIGNSLPIIKMYDVSNKASRNDGFAAPEPTSTEVHVSLNPEETLRFSDKEKAYVQIQVYYQDRNIVVGNIPQKVTVYPVFNDTPIVDIIPTEIVDDTYILDAGKISGGE